MFTSSLRLVRFSPRILVSFGQIAGLTLLTALSSKVQIPLGFSPVPITLQSFCVILSGIFLGAQRGAASQLGLIGLGLAGLPVFSSPLPGSLVLMGPTGGHIIGFVLCAYVSGWIFERYQNAGFIKQIFLVFISSLFIFLPGVIWLSQFTGMDIEKAALLGFLPFIPGDIIKCIAAVLFFRTAQKIRK